MRVWAVANQKGGVGKTTTSIALAGLLADAGKRVVVVDLDPHGSMTSYFGHDPDALEHSTYDLFLQQGNVPRGLPQRLLLPTSDERIALLPSSTALATLERQSPGQNGLGLVIAKSLAQLWNQFDHAIIDSPPLLGVLMVNALAASQQLVIPVQTEFLAVKGLERMTNTLTMINRSRKQALPYTIVPTLFDRRTQASMTTLRLLRNTYPEQLWQAYVPVDTRLRDASRAGLTPSQFDGNSRGVIAYRALLKHLLSHQPTTQVA
ncbi:chromosome partitioning protein [Pseudomonas fluvialis]|uniref:Chromosome partitioning protein n=1 Tax=Pseudomonas fluvialis TaxID=1793966 RepID=A0A7X0BRL4_9PSED|nr:ParA family protein [Pseudomonas fluvialis]MBB6341026.1 chromosome partitioning protein [Pseudomonas fluvialis]